MADTLSTICLVVKGETIVVRKYQRFIEGKFFLVRVLTDFNDLPSRTCSVVSSPTHQSMVYGLLDFSRSVY